MPHRTVLVADDNTDGRQTLRMLLEVMGYAVAVAETGPEAIAQVLAQPPDVAILDIGLPGCDGYEVARQVRATFGTGVLLIANTGYNSDEAHDRAVEAGFDHYLIKPTEPSQLLACMAGADHRTAGGRFQCNLRRPYSAADNQH